MMTETRIETYIPLYRKYRPQAFADMVGQEAIVQTLGNAINLSKVAHAYLFCGPRGTGKTSTARIFAKSLNCEQGPTVAPCQQCASCVGIANGNALDVIEFDAASNNGVADARELIENCQYSSMTGRFKVYIIDEVHMLTSQAFNALLKTLEEPPANVIFIFATTEAHKVLPTIISRCQRFDFNRITTENIISRLRFIAGEESISIDDEALLTIARHARGGLRDAVGLLDQVAVLGRAQQDKIIGRKDVAMFIGSLEEDLLVRLGNAIGERRAADLLSELGELLNRGIEPIQLLKDLTVHFRNLLIVSTAGANVNPDTLSLPPDYFEQLVAQAKLFPEPEEVPQIIGRLASVERNIRNSNQPQLWLEVGLIELAYRHEIHLVKELTERVARLESQLSGHAPVSNFAPQPAPQFAKPAAPQARPSAAPPAMPQPQSAPPTYAEKPAAPAFAPPVQPQTAPTVQAAPQPVPQSTAPPVPARPAMAPAAAGSLDAQYHQACAIVPSLPFRSLLQQQTFPISLNDDLLTVGCMSETHQTTLKKPDKFIHLQRAVDKTFGRPIRIEVVLEKKRPAGSVAPAVPAPTVPAPAPSAPAVPVSQPPAVPSLSGSQAPPWATAEHEAVAEPAPKAQSTVAVMEPPAAVATPVASPVPDVEANLHSGATVAAVTTMTPALKPEPVRPAAMPTSDDMPPMDLDAPPMTDDEGPPVDDDEPSGPINGTVAMSVSGSVDQAAMAGFSGDYELHEAKKNALDLLQGRVIE